MVKSLKSGGCQWGWSGDSGDFRDVRTMTCTSYDLFTHLTMRSGDCDRRRNDGLLSKELGRATAAFLVRMRLRCREATYTELGCDRMLRGVMPV